MPPVVSARHILGHLGRVMDIDVGYFIWLSRHMTLFDVSCSAVSYAEENATSGNYLPNSAVTRSTLFSPNYVHRWRVLDL